MYPIPQISLMASRGSYIRVLLFSVGTPIQEELDHIRVTLIGCPHERGISKLKRIERWSMMNRTILRLE